MTSPLRSAAQLRMLERAASDAIYATGRGISQETAQSLLDDHKAAGSPTLPDRVEAGEARAAKSGKTRTYKLLGSR